MLRSILVGAVIIAGATAVLAQSDAIAKRKDLMKSNGQAARQGAAIVRGTEPFELAKAQAIFANYENVGKQFIALFPEDSKTGGNTKASPKIWSDNAAFRTAVEKFTAEAAAASAATKDLETFRSQFGAVSRNCNGCHEVFQNQT